MREGMPVRRFYYSAIRDGKERDGVIRAESIDSAREQLISEGYEEISLSILSSIAPDIYQDKSVEDKDTPEPFPPS